MVCFLVFGFQEEKEIFPTTRTKLAFASLETTAYWNGNLESSNPEKRSSQIQIKAN